MLPPELPTLTIDGSTFSDFEGFQAAFSALLRDWTWNGNLDAFNDILRGGFGTPEDGWILRWVHADVSREALGYSATIARFEDILARCHPSNQSRVSTWLETARRQEGPTLFDDLVEIIRRHGPGGDEAEDNVILELD